MDNKEQTKNHNHALVFEAVIRYLNDPKITSYGYLLNGDWGSGKTYFWKNKILNQKLNSKSAYVSLFDQVSIQQLKSQILISYLSEVNKSETRTKIGKWIANFSLKFWVPAKNSLVESLNNLSKQHFEFDAKDFLNAIDFAIDPLSLLPDGVIVCFDDLERTSIPFKELLGVASYLVEQKNAKLVFLTSEKKIEDPGYIEFKEKVIRRTLQFETSVEEAYIGFCNDIADQGVKDRFIDLKPIFMNVFSDVECKNLRTLQKSLGIVDEFLRFDKAAVIPKSDIAFLIYLAVADSVGPLGENINSHKVGRTFFDTKKEDRPPLTAHQELYLKIEDSANVYGIKDFLFSFVRDGIIRKDQFDVEYAPKVYSESKVAILIRWDNDTSWWALNDVELNEKLQQFKHAFMSDEFESFGRILKAFTIGMRLASILGAEERFCDEVWESLVKFVKKNSLKDERIYPAEFDTSEYFKNKGEQLISIYKEERKNRKIAEAKEKIILDLEKSDLSEIAITSEEDFIALCELIEGRLFLQKLNEKRVSPTYFASACHTIVYALKNRANHSLTKKAKDLFDNFLNTIKSTTHSKVEIEMIKRVVEYTGEYL